MEEKNPLTCISCGQTGRHLTWCSCGDAPTHEKREIILDLTSKNRIKELEESLLSKDRDLEKQKELYKSLQEHGQRIIEGKDREIEEQAKEISTLKGLLNEALEQFRSI
jgi:tRNA/tmRNA/rRNA uracil-C5-methylase (TrmA/RlmC/RlmD family)